MNAERWARVLCALGLVALGPFACAQRAHAQASEPQAAQPSEPEAVLLTVPDCHEVLATDVQQLVALELAPRLRVLSDAGESHALTASVTCDQGLPVELRVDDSKRSTPLRSTLDLARTPAPARTRLLALALSELIATARLEHPEPAQPKPTQAKPAQAKPAQAKPAQAKPTPASAAGSSATAEEPDDDEDTEESSDTASQDQGAYATRLPMRVWLAPGLSRAFEPATMLFGVDGGVARKLSVFMLSAELGGRWGSASLDQAKVSLRMYSAALSLAPMLSLGAVGLYAGPGVRAGYVRLAGEARQADQTGDTLEGAWFGPMATAAAELAVLDGGMLRLAFEAGYATRAVAGHDAAEDDLMALRGVWFSTTLGFALGLR